MKLTDNDRVCGPLRFGKACSDAIFSLTYRTDDDIQSRQPQNYLTLIVFNWIFQLTLPELIKRIPSTIRLSGQDYAHYDERKYGITLRRDNVFLYFGVYSNRDLGNNAVKILDYPWIQYRMVRYELLDLNDNVVYSHAGVNEERYNKEAQDVFDAERNKVAKLHFQVRDYDGESIYGRAHVEEREWRMGRGHWRWLSAITKPLIRRMLEIEFDEEVGKDKGSWKGGMIGDSIDMLPGETPEWALMRYCEKKHRAKGGCYTIMIDRMQRSPISTQDDVPEIQVAP